MTYFQPKKGALKQCTIQYNVSGTLDGLTPAPSTQGIDPDEEGVIQVNVENLGIVDPDVLGGIASMGDRFLVWIRVESIVPFPAGFRISKVDATLSVPSLGIIELRRLTPTLTGERLFNNTQCNYIPQGQALQIGPSAVAPVGVPHRVWIEVRAATSGDDEARLAAMCCCQASPGPGGQTMGPPGPPGPPGESLSRQYYSFSTSGLSVGVAEDGSYFLWSAAYDGAEPDNLALSIVNENEGFVPFSGQKIAIRAGTVTNMSMLNTVACELQPFVEVQAGGAGAFVRTLMGPSVAVVANIVTAFTITDPVPFAAGDVIRCGVLATTDVTGDFYAEVEIETPT